MMKIFIWVFVLGFATVLNAGDADLSRKRTFDSVDAFVRATKDFDPSKSKTDFSSLFTIPMPGQPEESATGKPVPAEDIENCKIVWANHSHALVFATARPPTHSVMPSAIGVLFVLNEDKGRWKITDAKRFTAKGKYAKIEAELTAGVGVGYSLGSEYTSPVITIKESQGGRGYSYEVSASYILSDSKLKPLELE